MELKPCPNCGSALIRHNKRKGKYQFECGGECWTRTKWHWSEMEAKEEWNNLKKDMPSATWGEWQQLPDDYNWNVWRCSACSEEFVLEEGTPKENGYKFCPHCGATMVMEDEQYDFGFEEDEDDA